MGKKSSKTVGWLPKRASSACWAFLYWTVAATAVALSIILGVDPSLIHWPYNDIITTDAAVFGFSVFAFVMAMLGVEPVYYAMRKPQVAEPKRDTTPWHSLSREKIHESLHCTGTFEEYLHSGLRGHAQIQRQAAQYGKNALPAAKAPNAVMYFFKEIHEAQQMLLLIVAILYAFVGEFDEAVMALTIICLMAIAESTTEYRAKAAVSALGNTTPTYCTVIRDSQEIIIQKQEVVVGDLVILSAGNEVPADTRLLRCYDCHVNESLLTGEVVPVQKDANITCNADEPVTNRQNMAFAGTVVDKGNAVGIVTAVGMQSEVGQLLLTVNNAKSKAPKTELQRILKKVASILSVFAIVASIGGGLLGLVHAASWQSIVLTMLSLMFATIPEELPMLTAAVLAVGANVLARMHIYVKKLRVMEVLGAVDVLITDKTGTLTQNKLRVADVIAPQHHNNTDSINTDSDSNMQQDTAWIPSTIVSLASQGLPTLCWYLSAPPRLQESVQSGRVVSQADAFDSAVLSMLGTRGAQDMAKQLVDIQHVASDPFTSATKFSSVTIRERDEAPTVILRGAPDVILQRCSAALCIQDSSCRLLPIEDSSHATITALSKEGKRMLAYAIQRADAPQTCLWMGLMAFNDPLQASVAAAVGTCRAAGIDVIMCTGDHVNTAACIAQEAGLLDAADVSAVDCSTLSKDPEQFQNELRLHYTSGCKIYARATPEHKLALVKACQANGHTVAVTADGANDASALATSDVGIAVRNAVDIARDAAHIVMSDADFGRIVEAIREGRRLMDNLFHALCFYLGAKLALVIVFLIGTAWRGFVLQPVQIIVLEMFMDVGASTMFVLEQGDKDLLQRPPNKPRAFDKRMNLRITVAMICMLAATLGPYAYAGATGQSEGRACTMAFFGWLVAHVLLAMLFRTAERPLLKQKSIYGNIAMLVWMACVVIFTVLVCFVQVIQDALGIVNVTADDWGIIIGIAVASTAWVEVGRWILDIGRNPPGVRRVKYSSLATVRIAAEAVPLLE